MARKSTFTTYINTALGPNGNAGYDALEKRATAAYGSIARAAQMASAHAETASRLGGRGIGSPQQIQQARQVEQAYERTGRAARSYERDQNRVSQATEVATQRQTRFTRSLDTTARALSVAQGPLGPLAGKLNALKSIFEELSGIQFTAAVAGGVLLSVGRYAQAYTDTRNRLVPLFESQSQVNRAMEDVVGIANRARVALDPVADLYSKLTLAGPGLGRTQEQIGRLTELATKAARISGGAAQTQAAGLYQFAQGVGSGTLAGEELKSIKENTLFLAQQIAAGFKNADGSIGTTIDKLKELGSKGELTGTAVAEALERSAGRIEAAYARLPATVSSSLSKLGNNFTVLIGRADDAIGMTSILANTLSLLADNLDLAATGVTALAAAFFGSKLARYVTNLVQARKAAADLATMQRWWAEDATKASQRVLQGHIAEQREIRNKVNELRLLQRAQQAAVQTSETGASSGTAAKRRLYEGQLASQREALRLTTERLSAAERDHVVVQDSVARAITVAEQLQEALTQAKERAIGAGGRLRAGLGSLVDFLGGPWGIAFAAATAALGIFSGRMTTAERAAAGLTSQQLALADAAYKSAYALDLSSAAAARSSSAKALSATNDAISDAKAKRADMAKSLRDVADNLGFGSAGNKQIREMSRRLAAGADPDTIYSEFYDLRRRDKSVQKASTRGAFMSWLKGSALPVEDALAEVRKSRSVLSGNIANLRDAEAAVTEFSKPTSVGKPKGPVSTARLRAAGEADAINSGTRAITAATRKRNEALRALDEEFGVKGGKIAPDKADAYQARVAEITRAYDQETASARAASAGSRAAGAQKRKAEAAAHKAFMAEQRERRQTLREQADERLNASMQGLEDERPLMTQQAYLDARLRILKTYDDEINAIDAKAAKSTKAADQELRDKRATASALREITQEFDRNMQVSVLQMQGREAEAQALRRTLDLVDRIGDAGRDQYGVILAQERAYERVNDLIESRNRIIQTQLNVLDTARDGFEDFLVGLPDKAGGGFKTLFRDIMTSLNRVWARKITEKIFAGSDEKVRALIQGNQSIEGATARFATQVDQTSGSAKSLAQSLDEAAQEVNRITESLRGDAPAGSTSTVGSTAVARSILGLGTGIGGVVAAGAGGFSGLFSQAIDSALADIRAEVGGDATTSSEIVVRGQAPAGGGGQSQSQSASRQLGLGATIFSTVGEQLDKVFGRIRKMDTAGTATNGAPPGFFTKMGATFGKAFEGAGQGALASGFARALGIKQSSTGAAVGGAIGSFLGPAGGLIGGLIGGTIGGLFKKTPKGQATITNESVSYSGSGKLKSGLTTLGTGVQDSIANIAEQLGGDVGAYSVSVRQKKKKFYVNGQKFGDEAEAARAALLAAIQQGAVKGITQGAQNLLRAGQDIERQVAKAVKFQNVFDELKSIKDPMGFAIEQLNRDFSSLKDIFAEAGASAADYAALEELYGLKRAEAIKSATEAATGAIDRALKDMVGGSDSPLNRQDTYQNARQEVDKYRADLASGKRLSQDDLNDLLASARNFQDASRTLNGSGAAFFQDFEDIRALLTQARTNAGLSDIASLPASPFAQQTVDAIAAGTSATEAQTAAVVAALGNLAPDIAQLISDAIKKNSPIGLLPGFQGLNYA